MPYTGQEIFNMSIALIDELSDSGTVNDNQIKEYKNRAPYLLDMWQHEFSRFENITDITKLTSLSQTLQVSDKGCISGAYYLARHFALADQNTELANICESKYQELKREGRKPLPTADITDAYGIVGE